MFISENLNKIDVLIMRYNEIDYLFDYLRVKLILYRGFLENNKIDMLCRVLKLLLKYG